MRLRKALSLALLASSACTYGTVQDASNDALLGAASVEFQVPDTTSTPGPIPGIPNSGPIFMPATTERRPLVSAVTWSATDPSSGGSQGAYYLNEYSFIGREFGKSYYVPSGWVRARVEKAGFDPRVFYRNHLYRECVFTALQGATSGGSSIFFYPLTLPLLTNVAGSPPRCAEQSFRVYRSSENYVRDPDLIVDPRGLRDRKIDVCDDPDRNGDGVLDMCLRVTVATANVGDGHLMIRADWNGTEATNVRQQRYRRNSTGIDDGVENDPLAAAKFEYHPAPDHNHIHLRDWAQMRLRRFTAACPIERLAESCPVVNAAVSPKVGFCLQNSFVYDKTMIEQKNAEVFNGQTCDVREGTTQLFQGIKSGYGDVYSKLLEGQEIRLAGLFVGDYWLEVEVNPPNDQGQRLAIESDYTNNVSRLRISLLDF